MNALKLKIRLKDVMHNLRIDSGATIEYRRGMLVAVYGLLVGIYKQRKVEELIKETLPLYIYKGVIPGDWINFRELYEESHTEGHGLVVLKKKK